MAKNTFLFYLTSNHLIILQRSYVIYDEVPGFQTNFPGIIALHEEIKSNLN